LPLWAEVCALVGLYQNCVFRTAAIAFIVISICSKGAIQAFVGIFANFAVSIARFADFFFSVIPTRAFLHAIVGVFIIPKEEIWLEANIAGVVIAFLAMAYAAFNAKGGVIPGFPF